MDCYFGIDIGGTNIKFGKFINGELTNFFEVHTWSKEDCDPVDGVISIIKESVLNNLEEDDNLIGLGIAVPGPVDNGVVLGAENLKWGEVKLKELLNAVFKDIKIEILNDANSATLGEWYYGSGEKSQNLVFVTLGTGVGGGIILNNELYLGDNGSAGEIGHIRIMPFNGRPCSCGLSGCLEQYASATGIKKTAYGLRKRKDTILNNKGRIGVRDIFEAAESGDKVANDVINKTAYYLAIGLADIAATINPKTIIIGGGVSKGGDTLLKPLKECFKKLAYSTVKDTEIKLASLFNKAGCYGAYYYVSKGIK